jgi:periplasmic protein CpxP/Spy
MKASLLARVAPALVLTGVLAGGVVVAGHAQTTSPQPGATTPAPAGAAPPAGGTATTTPGSTSTTQPGTTPPPAGAAMAPQANAPAAQGNAPASPAAQGNAPASPAAAAPPQTISQMVAQRISDLRSRLNISPAQEPKFNRFAAVMRSNARELDRAYRRRGERIGSMDALQSMESYARMEQTRANAVQRLVPAFRALYASLTPQQRQTADELFRERMAAAQQRH